MTQQPWSDEVPDHGTIVVVTANPIGQALVAMAAILGRRTVLLDAAPGADPAAEIESTDPMRWLQDNPQGPSDVLVLCDHDAPNALDLVRGALSGSGGYVAMMGSRARAGATHARLREEGFDDEALSRFHMPAGLNVGGRGPGEIALSVLAEVVADSYGRDGGPMRAG